MTVPLLYLAGLIATLELTNGMIPGTVNHPHMINAKAIVKCAGYPLSIVDGEVIEHDLISITILVGGPLLSFFFTKKGMQASAASTALCSCAIWGVWVWFSMKMRALGAC
jgi:hypothetical protein